MTKIPSEFLRGVAPEVGDAFRKARKAIESHGPLDDEAREYVMLAIFAAAGFEESFRIHALRALNRGLSKAAIQQAVLIPFGATVGLLPIVQALRWIEDACERQAADGAGAGSVRSPDGATIGYQRRGDGTPLVLVHGATSERSRWSPVLPALGSRFTTFAMDRRGRGASADVGEYRIEKEFSDIAALIDSIGGAVDVIAHSYGAICALEASRLTRNIRRLVLYEPPITVQEPTAEESAAHARFIGELDAHVKRGDHAAALDAFFQRSLGMSKEETAALRSTPSWPARLALGPTLPRELREAQRYRFDASSFQGFVVPTLIVLGGDSPPRHQRCAEMLKASLPGSKLAVLAGHGHRAIDTAPTLFSATVLDFLTR